MSQESEMLNKKATVPEFQSPEQLKYKLVTNLIDRINTNKPITNTEYHFSKVIEHLEALLEASH